MLEESPGARITTAALAKKVGVSEAALYRHFPSKTKMFEGLIEFIEDTISPFELQKADELFITNVVHGIQPITIYRKKSYTTTVSQNLLAKLNMSLRLS